MNGQSQLGSVIESLANIVVGYLVAVTAQALLFPLFGIYVPLRTNFIIGAAFTVVSFIRSYILRRVFNSLRKYL